MKKHLYSLLDTKTREYLTLVLRNKTQARGARRARNRALGDPLRYMVVPGPDHPLYQQKEQPR